MRLKYQPNILWTKSGGTTFIASGSLADTSDDGWDAMMAVNVRAPFRLIREAAQSLIERRGAVVNVSSVAGLRAFPGLASYAVSKAALEKLVDARSSNAVFIGVDPCLQALHAEPRFQRVITRLGVPMVSAPHTAST